MTPDDVSYTALREAVAAVQRGHLDDAAAALWEAMVWAGMPADVAVSVRVEPTK